MTLISTVGHLHPGGLSTGLRVRRGDQHRRIFTSKAHYYEPAGAVSWDVAMGATPKDWRVKLQAGDTLSVHATYDVSRADWYEVMGIMPVAVYDGINVGGVDAFSNQIPPERGAHARPSGREQHHGGGPDQPAGPEAPAERRRPPTQSGSSSTNTGRVTCTPR